MNRLLRSQFARDAKFFVNCLAIGLLVATAWAGYELWLSKYPLGTAVTALALLIVVVVNTAIHSEEE